jgi:hypothetical protein
VLKRAALVKLTPPIVGVFCETAPPEENKSVEIIKSELAG